MRVYISIIFFLVINVCCALIINDIHVNRGIHLHDGDEKDLLKIDGGLFWPVFLTMSCLLVAISCYGFVYEFTRRRSSETGRAADSAIFMKGNLD